jgi:SPP1 gp7 family putative phage head morphogenesis protein
VKLGEGLAFAEMINGLKDEIRSIIVGVKYGKLSDMTKTELYSLILAISKVQGKAFNEYSADLNKFLYSFMNADAALTKRVLATAFMRDIDPTATVADDTEALEFFEYEEENSRRKPVFGWDTIHRKDTFPALWSKIGNGFIPANGLTLAQFIKAFTDSAQGSVLNAVRAAWANDLTPEEAATGIVGNDKTGESGILDRVINQGRAVIDTTTQTVSQGVSGGINSALFDRYRWDSVMDSHTTDICRHRNGHIYVYGEGPMPPAHIRCRSHTTPVNGSDDTERQTLYSWASSQSVAFQRATFSGAGRTLADIRPMTVDQFASEATTILS